MTCPAMTSATDEIGGMGGGGLPERSAELEEHEVHLFLQADTLGPWNGLETRFADLAGVVQAGDKACQWVPEPVRHALRGRYADASIWETVTPRTGEDFHPHVRHLVRGESPHLAVLWTATGQALRLLNKADLYAEDTPRDARVTRSLIWLPGARARQRLVEGGVPESEAVLYRLQIRELMAYGFCTGKTFLRVAIGIQLVGAGRDASAPRRGLLPVELQEIVVALARHGKIGWLEGNGGVSEIPAGAAAMPAPERPDEQVPPYSPVSLDVSFADLVRSLAGVPPGESGLAKRNFTYTFARFSAPVEPGTADRFALYLARHYTRDYRVRTDLEDIVRVRDFETVGHTIALEGMATVVTPDGPNERLPEFLRNFTQTTLHKHYVPMALLAQHEHAFLIEKTVESNIWTAYTGGREQTAQDREMVRRTIARLSQLRRDSLAFRLAFRFSQISLISMHNEVNHGLRHALDLDGMLAQLSADVSEAGAFLDASERKDEEIRREAAARRLLSIGRLGSSVLAGFAVSDAAIQLLPDWIDSKSAVGWTALGLLLFVTGMVYLIQWWNGRRRGMQGEEPSRSAK